MTISESHQHPSSTSTSTMASTLLELCTLISSSIAAVDARCKTLSRTYPDLDNPSNAADDESVVNDGEIAEAAAVAIAAASQLIAHLQSPAQKVLETSLAFLISTALGVVSASATAEIIREAGPQGCHIEEIAKKNGMDPLKIARVLRPLATQHIFREVSPDVFAHNRVSTTLDTGKSSQEVLAAPEDKHQGAEGFAAVVELNTDETLKAGAYIRDVVVTDRREGADELDTPLNRAFNTHVDLFSWFELPENRIRFRRFGMAMDAGRRVSPFPSSALNRFDWSSLREDTLIVDVGAGIGSVSFGIAKANPNLRFLIQDKASVIQEGKEFWEKELPDAFASGRVSFQEHDFFSPQPVKTADIFLLSRICHDWSDTYVHRILKHLRDAAQPTTKLIIQERIIPFVCGENDSYNHIPGAMSGIASPKPLLANMGRMVPYLTDMQMMALLSGCERTLPHYFKLCSETGWEIERVYRAGPDPMNQMVLRPI
ncbi:O-methyltransferase [Mycena sanguinolenta]|nr:O-methyltransferase [Mycena sanguinolenta]